MPYTTLISVDELRGVLAAGEHVVLVDTRFDLADLNAGGTRVALLSNAGFDFGDPFRRAPFARYFEKIYVSAELGMIKPDPEIYRYVARDLGIEPSEMVFIDNKKVNVEGAESIGVTGHVFTGVGELRTFLNTLSSASPAESAPV